MSSCAVVIGDRADLHVQAVLAHLDREVIVLDADSIGSGRYRLEESRLQLEVNGGWAELRAHDVRGWIRRVAPIDWQKGEQIGSLQSATASAWLSLIAAIVRLPQISWLTHVDPLFAAENKAHQLEVARLAGVPVPRSLITNDIDFLGDELGEEFVIKPLGRGHFTDGAETRVVFAQSTSASELAGLVAEPPFLFQERLIAKQHLRVVVVGDRVWAASLQASGLPLDWRQESDAHDSFRAIVPTEQVRRGALATCQALGVAFASQDWIVAHDGAYLVDVNPGGQWLFLPEEVSEPVTSAIADWIAG